MRPDALGTCLLKQTASGAQSVTSSSKIEGFREFEADLSALFCSRSSTRGGIAQVAIPEGEPLTVAKAAVPPRTPPYRPRKKILHV